jgi:hypothetical protein
MGRSPDRRSTKEHAQEIACASKTVGEKIVERPENNHVEETANAQESRWENPSSDSADTEDVTNIAATFPHRTMRESELDGRSADSERELFVEYDQDDPLAEFLGDEDDLLEKNATAAVMSLLSSPLNRTTGNEKTKAFLGWFGNSKAENERDDHPKENDSEIPPEAPLLSKKAAALLGNISDKMNDPTNNLAPLISAISTPDSGEFNRGYMVRRKNACGAIHLLTSKKGTQRVKICWTKGVLHALQSVLEDGQDQDLEEKFPNAKTRKEYKEARKRVVATLMNLSIPQENRVIVFHSPKLIPVLLETIKSAEECSKSGAAALAHLAKTKENRLFLGRVPGLIDTVVAIIEPKPVQMVQMDNKDHQVSNEKERIDSHIEQSQLSASSTHSEYIHEPHDARLDVDQEAGADLNEESRTYDEDGGEHLRGARQNIFALLLHLVKEKDNTVSGTRKWSVKLIAQIDSSPFYLLQYIFARHDRLVESLAKIARLLESDFHEYSCKIIANLTRHRANTRHLLFKHPDVVQALVTASYSQHDESRKHACYALQNFAEDKPCRQELAATKNVLSALCVRIRQAFDHEERLAAIHALKSLSEEPANLILMTNTPECFPSLMQIADASDDNVSEMMQFVGCDALANLSNHFRLIATSGKNLDNEKRGEPTSSNELFVPSLKLVTWEQWE